MDPTRFGLNSLIRKRTSDFRKSLSAPNRAPAYFEKKRKHSIVKGRVGGGQSCTPIHMLFAKASAVQFTLMS